MKSIYSKMNLRRTEIAAVFFVGWMMLLTSCGTLMSSEDPLDGLTASERAELQAKFIANPELAQELRIQHAESQTK